MIFNFDINKQDLASQLLQNIHAALLTLPNSRPAATFHTAQFI
ncbi:hypothetical protein SynBIOSU31_00329 [Synechococcus sp. BIOS-U3-1]|nr:hypothetical protein SynBIOSU31_00329 [Synechococcus sp. BIOS-U3-1]